MTAQISETLILDGEEYAMAYCPDLPPNPELLVPTEWLTEVTTDEKGKTHEKTWETWTDRAGITHRALPDMFTDSSACWRGYRGTWKIEGGRLWLVELQGRVRLAVDGPIIADWVTAVLRVPRGDMLHYVHMGFGSVYEEEVHIMVERGMVRGQRVFDNRERTHDTRALAGRNLPGSENEFPGDKDFN